MPGGQRSKIQLILLSSVAARSQPLGCCGSWRAERQRNAAFAELR